MGERVEDNVTGRSRWWLALIYEAKEFAFHLGIFR
jgi:hypothetical protein